MSRRWIPWLVGILGGCVFAGAIALGTRNASISRDPFILVFLLVVVSYLLADRLDAVGGELRIRSAPGDGTVVGGSVPLTASAGRSTSRPVRAIERSGA